MRQLASNVVKIWAAPRSYCDEGVDPPMSEMVPIMAGTIGVIEFQWVNSWNVVITNICFPGDLMAELGPSAWVGEGVDDANGFGEEETASLHSKAWQNKADESD